MSPLTPGPGRGASAAPAAAPAGRFVRHDTLARTGRLASAPAPAEPVAALTREVAR